MSKSTIVNDIEKKSKYLIYTPSFSELAFSVTGAGHFYAHKNYLVDRDNLKSMYLIIYTLNGCGNITYRGRSFLLQPGYAILLNGEEYHKYYSSSTTDGNWEFKWARFSSSHAELYDNLITHSEARPLYIDEASFEHKIDILINLLQGHESIKDVRMSCVLDEMLTTLYVASQQHLEKHLTKTHLDMTACRRYILNNYSNQLSVSDLAERSCITEAAFIRKFKKFFSITPYAFIQKTRLSNATLLLETTNKPVSEICYSVGYTDQNNFSKQFRAYYNQSPSEYRKQFRSHRPNT